MDKLLVFDTTIRDGQLPNCKYTKGQKIEIARQLEKLNVDVIEAGFASQGDVESIQEIAQIVKNCTVASLARTIKNDIDDSYGALKNAVSPRIHLYITTGSAYLENSKMTESDILEIIKQMVAYAKSKVSDIEFTCADATRTDKTFLCRAVETAIKNGATTIGLPDTFCFSTPEEMGVMIDYIRHNVTNIDEAIISSHNHNDLGLAVANTLACIKAGARQVECTINGVGIRAGNASLEEVITALEKRFDYYKIKSHINMDELYPTCKMVSEIIQIPIPAYKAVVGSNSLKGDDRTIYNIVRK